MSVLVIGLNHRSASLDVLEQVAVAQAHIPKTLAVLRELPSVDEAVLLSTCNRLEVYAWAEKFHSAYENLRDHLAQQATCSAPEMAGSAYSLYDTDAVRHLFAVVSGLDSAVLGEAEIQGQVKQAWCRRQLPEPSLPSRAGCRQACTVRDPAGAFPHVGVRSGGGDGVGTSLRLRRAADRGAGCG